MRTVRAVLESLAVLALVGISVAGAIDLQGHRGARGLAPENTLTGFRRAMLEGVSTLELDIGLTRDRVAVVHHDDALNPDLARDAAGQWLAEPRLIHEMTSRELSRFDVGRVRPGTPYATRYPKQEARDGETIPTLDRLFAMVSSTSARALRFNIETKLSPLAPERSAAPEAMAEAVLRTAERHRMLDRVTLQSFDWRTLSIMRRLAPEVPTIHLTVRQPWLNNIDPRWNAGLNLADHGSVPRLVKAAGGRGWSPYFGDLDAADLAEARSLGLKVIVWTVNTPADIERMLDMGVDGLITDYPDLARRMILERGLTIGPVDWESGEKSSPDTRRSQ
jgi:glycerophosphoryl diester phosphodiesterase